MQSPEALLAHSQCPSAADPPGRSAVCKAECGTDGDCPGLRRCCVLGCSKLCLHPPRTTACLHRAVSAELFGLAAPRCTADGAFAEVQCDASHCQCVRPSDGRPRPGSRGTAAARFDCTAARAECGVLECGLECRHGFRLDDWGCPTCQCEDPCRGVRCPLGTLCLPVAVPCLHSADCPEQPRCESEF